MCFFAHLELLCGFNPTILFLNIFFREEGGGDFLQPKILISF